VEKNFVDALNDATARGEVSSEMQSRNAEIIKYKYEYSKVLKHD